MINWSFFQKIYSCKFMSMIFKIILFLPIVDKHSKFYQTGILRDCVWIKYLPSYFLSSASHSKKETKIESLKLDNSICDTESYFQMRQILSIFETSFNYDFLNPGFKESRPFTWLKQNGATDLSWDQDDHTMFTKRQGTLWCLIEREGPDKSPKSN